ncbi:hypothetical protein JXB37_06660 [candidate division WOR-3 bacterium]|nr:hypothetical protein [candidate division WOR-3 bacterium]
MESLLARLRAEAGARQKLVKLLAGYARLLDDPVNNATRRETELARVARAVEAVEPGDTRQALDGWLAAERERLGSDRDAFRFEFGTRLAQELARHGLGARGQLPVLRVGLVSLRCDFAGGKAALWWGPEVEQVKTGLALAPEGLADEVAGWLKDLRDKAADPAETRRRLVEAYRRCRLLGGLEPGARVGLLDVLAEVVHGLQPKSFRADPTRQRFVEYPRVRFSFDLFRLKTAGEGAGPRLRLHVATFDATTAKGRALWVPDNEDGEGTYYSYLSTGGEA